MTASRVVTRHMSGANQLGSRPRAGWATEAHGPLECYRDFRQKYARATSQPFRRAAGVFATSTRATGARVKLCQAQAVGRFPAESYSLPIPSFPLQPLRPHNARTRARARDRRWNFPADEGGVALELLPSMQTDVSLRSPKRTGLRSSAAFPN